LGKGRLNIRCFRPLRRRWNWMMLWIVGVEYILDTTQICTCHASMYSID
jgi:hypothetical protein